MRSYKRVLQESVIVGLALLATSYIINFVMQKVIEYSPTSEISSFLQKHAVTLHPILCGIVLHLVMEYTGLNEKFCKQFKSLPSSVPSYMGEAPLPLR